MSPGAVRPVRPSTAGCELRQSSFQTTCTTPLASCAIWRVTGVTRGTGIRNQGKAGLHGSKHRARWLIRVRWWLVAAEGVTGAVYKCAQVSHACVISGVAQWVDRELGTTRVENCIEPVDNFDDFTTDFIRSLCVDLDGHRFFW